MKRAWRAILFLLPLVIVFGGPVLVLWLGGEFIAPDTIVQRQMDDAHPVRHGAAYTDPAIYIKTRLAAQKKARVLVLGNSRVLEFRREFFLPDVTFFNAGLAASRIRHYRAFLEAMPTDSLPEMLILATEAGYFNLKFDSFDGGSFDVAWLHKQMKTQVPPAEIFQTRWRDVWGDIAAGKVKWSRLASLDGLRTRIGVSAVSKDDGLRNDGSYRYSPLDLDMTDSHHHDADIERTLKDVAKGGSRFPWGDTVSEPALREMDAVFDFCAAHHIHLIGFMPPHPHVVWEAIQAQGEHYEYLRKLEPTLRPRFEARGFEFYNFSDLAVLGSPDSEALDGYHCSERAFLRLFISMLEQGSRLNAVADLPALRMALASKEWGPYPFPERSWSPGTADKDHRP